MPDQVPVERMRELAEKAIAQWSAFVQAPTPEGWEEVGITLKAYRDATEPKAILVLLDAQAALLAEKRTVFCVHCRDVRKYVQADDAARAEALSWMAEHERTCPNSPIVRERDALAAENLTLRAQIARFILAERRAHAARELYEHWSVERDPGSDYRTRGQDRLCNALAELASWADEEYDIAHFALTGQAERAEKLFGPTAEEPSGGIGSENFFPGAHLPLKMPAGRSEQIAKAIAADDSCISAGTTTPKDGAR